MNIEGHEASDAAYAFLVVAPFCKHRHIKFERSLV